MILNTSSPTLPLVGWTVSLLATISLRNSDQDDTASTDDSRLLSPALGGGALLDLGPYPLLWVGADALSL